MTSPMSFVRNLHIRAYALACSGSLVLICLANTEIPWAPALARDHAVHCQTESQFLHLPLSLGHKSLGEVLESQGGGLCPTRRRVGSPPLGGQSEQPLYHA
jgi:hypothetical protein